MSRPLPPLALRVLAATLPRGKAEHIVGDLAEEYDARATASTTEASRWLRRQLLGSAPRFLWQRAEAAGLTQLAALVAWTIACCLAILAWESQVARQVAGLAQARFEAAPFAAVRTLYVLVQAAAFAVVGALLARRTFRRDQGFLRNALLRLTPFAVVIFAPAFFARLTGETGYSMLFLLPWSLALTAALLGGARLAWRHLHI